MYNFSFKTAKNFIFSVAFVTGLVSVGHSQVTRSAAGANPAAIQAAVDQFRADLGGANNGVGGSFTSGRREINWDGVPNAQSAPNGFLPNFFNVTSPRGVIFTGIPDGTSPTGLDGFSVSANAASGTAVRFGDRNASYPTIFQTFSAERLFTATNTHTMEISFFVPGTTIPATVAGFGAVFCDVDNTGGVNATFIHYIRSDGIYVRSDNATAFNNGLSFVGTTFPVGTRIARVIIEFGNAELSGSNTDGVGGVDVVAMDDFIYGEPRAAQFHSGDADGDGIADARVFRPSAGTWFTLNSGSNTISIEQFGVSGDIPIDGDFDGDSRADLAVFRPSDGGWYVRRSSNNTFITQAFGVGTDKPVAGDYDKDGKTDIAVWRPSTGNYFVLRSSDNQASFFAFPFGQTGDIPVQGGAQ